MAEERKEDIKNAKNEKVAVPRAKRPYHRRSNKKTENVEEKKTRVKNKENVEENEEYQDLLKLYQNEGELYEY